jgi:OHCU decarboxylase
VSGLDRLNALPAEAAERELLACCGAREWARRMAAARPFADEAALLARAEDVWWALDQADWREAFRAHPPIGGRKAEAETSRSERERGWSSAEQAGMRSADQATRAALAEGNRVYQERFGFVYLVCATGKSAEEMLALLRARLENPPGEEIRVAAAEQAKITALRLRRLVGA